MNRRQFINQTSAFGITGVTSLLVVSKPIHAQSQLDEVLVNTNISNNHGHELNLTSGQILKVLKTTLASGPLKLSVQGSSRHDHSILITAEDIIKLLINEQLSLETSEDSGHKHLVTINLENLT